jgi:hypothetical protein
LVSNKDDGGLVPWVNELAAAFHAAFALTAPP